MGASRRRRKQLAKVGNSAELSARSLGACATCESRLHGTEVARSGENLRSWVDFVVVIVVQFVFILKHFFPVALVLIRSGCRELGFKPFQNPHAQTGIQ